MMYKVTYRDKTGAVREERVEAAGRAECIEAFRMRGISPMKIEQQRGGGSGGWSVQGVNTWARRSLTAIAAVALLAAVVGGAWWWLGSSKTPPPADNGVRPVRTPRRTNDVVSVQKPKRLSPPEVVAVTNGPNGRPVRHRGPVYDKDGKRVFKNPDSPVARSWRSRHGQPPLVDFREEPDPNAPPPRYTNNLQFNLAEFAVPGRPSNGADPITDREARELLKQKVEYLFDDPESVLEEKHAVAELQEQLREWMDNGGHAMQFMQKLAERQERESEAMMEIQKNVMEFCKAGDRVAAATALEKYNAYLESKGMPRMKMTHRMKRALEKAGGGETAVPQTDVAPSGAESGAGNSTERNEK